MNEQLTSTYVVIDIGVRSFFTRNFQVKVVEKKT